MQIPLEITYRDVQKTAATEELIRRKVGKLERLCTYIISIRVTVESSQEHQRSGSPYRVGIYLSVQRVALVDKLFPEKDYGFLKTVDGRVLYFHRNSVLADDFDRLEIGTGVRYVETMGDKGPQASTVQIVDKPGVRHSTSS
ncbi:MAG: HPF/RaiA family ribosome-associated protein [Deltaproteobacteria bacterium]